MIGQGCGAWPRALRVAPLDAEHASPCVRGRRVARRDFEHGGAVNDGDHVSRVYRWRRSAL